MAPVSELLELTSEAEAGEVLRRLGVVPEGVRVEARALSGGISNIDVFEPERLPADHPLLAQERLLATPHTAFYSDESMRDLARLAAENVAAVLAGRAPSSLVNPQILERR